jgi:hypothetical protein
LDREEASNSRCQPESAGLYDIGDGASINLGDVHPLEVVTWPEDPDQDRLTIRIDENTTLEIVEQEDLP